MIIVLKPNTSDKDIARVEHQIKRNGLDTHIVRGQEMTIIGCIGDTTRLDARLFEVDASVDKVMQARILSRDSDWKDLTFSVQSKRRPDFRS